MLVLSIAIAIITRNHHHHHHHPIPSSLYIFCYVFYTLLYVYIPYVCMGSLYVPIDGWAKSFSSCLVHHFIFVSFPLNPVCLIIYYPLSPLYRNKIMGLKIVSEGKTSDGPIQWSMVFNHDYESQWVRIILCGDLDGDQRHCVDSWLVYML